MKRPLRLWLSAAFLLSGCADSAPSGDPDAPRITGLDKRALTIGESLWFDGENLPSPEDGGLRLRFDGQFTATDGQSERVAIALSPHLAAQAEGSNSALWPRFGPFANPFSSRAVSGTFRGHIVAEVIDAEGVLRIDSKPETFSIDVLPSIEVTGLEPIQASCGAPAVRALAGLPYLLGVRAVGLEPVRWRYAIAEINGAGGVTVHEHTNDVKQAPGRDVLGDAPDEPVIFNPVPDGEQFYVAAVQVQARDAAGNVVETALPLTVHRPIEVAAYGGRDMAERYDAVPVSGCTPGSLQTQLSYSEARTEYRQRSVGVTVSNRFAQSSGNTNTAGWEEGISTGESESHTLGESKSEREQLSESTGVTYSEEQENNTEVETTDGEHWTATLTQGESAEQFEEDTHSMYGEASAKATVSAEVEGSIPLLASASGSVSTTAGVTAGQRVGGTDGRRESQSTESGFTASGGQDRSRSYGSTVAVERSESVSGEYALSHERDRDHSDMSTRTQSEVWSLAQGKSEEEITSRGDEAAEERTWSDSSSDTTVTSYRGFVPKGRFGIFYRQTTRWVKRAEVRAYDLCGVARHIGELQFNEWTWAPDLAIGDTCDATPPPSNLPPAGCFVPPCDQ